MAMSYFDYDDVVQFGPDAVLQYLENLSNEKPLNVTGNPGILLIPVHIVEALEKRMNENEDAPAALEPDAEGNVEFHSPATWEEIDAWVKACEAKGVSPHVRHNVFDGPEDDGPRAA